MGRHKVTIGATRIKKYFITSYPWAVPAIERDGGRCRHCQVSESLVVHHLDESRKKGVISMNNELSNLITLCRKCHAKIHKQTLDVDSPRVKDMITMRESGNTLQEIGNKYNLSRERVRQILTKVA